MAASGSMKIVFNFSCFSTSLLAALLPFLPLLPFFNIWSAIVSQVLALKARKPNPIRQLMLVSTALAVSVPWMLVYQVYFIIGFTWYLRSNPGAHINVFHFLILAYSLLCSWLLILLMLKIKRLKCETICSPIINQKEHPWTWVRSNMMLIFSQHKLYDLD